MSTLSHLFLPANTQISTAFTIHIEGLHGLPVETQCGQPPLFQVIPAGIGFFHIKEVSTGRVRGFREDHNKACALARSLESRIELLAADRLR